MKRKHGIGKRKSKLASLTKEGDPNTVSANTRDEWDLDHYNNNEVNGTSEIEHRPQMSNQQTSQVDLRNQKVAAPAVDDSTSSFPGLNNAASTSSWKKIRSKMSKSSNAISSANTKQISNSGNVQIGGTHQRGLELPNQDSEFKEQELKVALEVIRKVMKMDAAEPFNVPVDPVAQGIPDYFDIIDTPMDFGTICYNIECGAKYKNSEDVVKDVQYIWDNCCRYNRKGHFILELMKRVKKNFDKYWTEAGLGKDQQQEIDDTHIPPSKPTTPYNIYGNRSPLASLANCARSLQQGREDLTSPQLDYPSLARSESYKSHQRPGHYQEDTMRRNPRDYSVDPLDHVFAHAPIHPRQNPHEIPHSHSSLWRNEPYQLQQRSHQSYPTHVQPPQTYHQDSAFFTGAGHPRTTHRTEPTARVTPSGHWCSESHHAEKNMYHQPEYHDHQSSLCCSRPYRPQMDFYPCSRCSGHAEGDFDWHLPEPRNSNCPMTGLTNHRRQDQRALSGLHKGQPSEPCGVDFDSHQSRNWSLSYSKQGPSNSKHPMIDFTSDLPQQQTDLSFMPKQQPSETCGDEEIISPPPIEPMVTVAMGGPPNYPVVSMTEIINRKLLDELTPSQQPDKLHEPQMESCQGQSFSQSQSQSPPPQAPSDVIPAVSNKTTKKSNSRGPTRCLKVFDAEEKIPITTNEVGEPIGDEAQKLITFLGVIARNGHLTPLNYVKWKQLPEENKEKMWQLIQSKFDINPESKIWALKSLAKKWSSWKALLKVNHYNPHETDEARLADCDERVLPDQWRILVQFWNSSEAQVVSDRNKANRAHLKYCHAAGTKSFARVREEQRLKRPEGKDVSEADLFILTRTRKNGQPVSETSSKIIVVSNKAKANRAHVKYCHAAGSKSFARVREEQRLKRPEGKDLSEADLFILTRTRKNGQPVSETSSKIISELHDAAQQKHGTSKPDTIENEVLAQVLGEVKHKRKRGHAYRLGPAPSNTLPLEAEKIVLESKAEVLEMKEKMVAVEQTCAQMAAQMAAMMSMMQKNYAATNTPNLDASVHPEESEDVSASRNDFQTLKSSATKAGKKHDAGEVARRKT